MRILEGVDSWTVIEYLLAILTTVFGINQFRSGEYNDFANTVLLFFFFAFRIIMAREAMHNTVPLAVYLLQLRYARCAPGA